MKVYFNGRNKDKYFLIDEEDFELINKHKWYLRSDEYVYNKSTMLHRFIMGVSDPKIKVDHKDGNGLNNCRDNLRICSSQQNNMNKRLFKGASRYKGVDFYRSKWRAKIMYNKKSYHLGIFNTEEDAAKAYDKKAIELFGEFAILNEVLSCD